MDSPIIDFQIQTCFGFPLEASKRITNSSLSLEIRATKWFDLGSKKVSYERNNKILKIPIATAFGLTLSDQTIERVNKWRINILSFEETTRLGDCEANCADLIFFDANIFWRFEKLGAVLRCKCLNQYKVMYANPTKKSKDLDRQ